MRKFVLREQGPQCVHTIGAAEANEEFPKIRHRFQKPSVWEGALGLPKLHAAAQGEKLYFIFDIALSVDIEM